MSRLRSLQDFIAAKVDAMVECKACRRRVRADPARLFAGLKVKWRNSLDYQGTKLRCSACGHRGARIAPVPKVQCTVDWDSLRADVERMWERVMANESERPFKIEGPDADGFVWIFSPEGRDVWCHNLGTRDQAAEVMVEWLGAVEYLERE